MTEDPVLSDKMTEFTSALIEHGDAVLILVSVTDSGECFLYHRYAGSWHSVLGMIEHFKLMKLVDKIKDD